MKDDPNDLPPILRAASAAAEHLVETFGKMYGPEGVALMLAHCVYELALVDADKANGSLAAGRQLVKDMVKDGYSSSAPDRRGMH